MGKCSCYFKETQLKCPQCNNVTTIQRRTSKLKKVGHLKKLWCYKCKEEINHVELVDASEFDINEDCDLTPVNKNQDRIRYRSRIGL